MNRRFQLSKKTWHYRVYRRLRNFWEDMNVRGPMKDYQPHSLCSYFWMTVLMTLALPLFAVLAGSASVIVVLTAVVWYPIYRRKKTLRKQWAAYEDGGPRPNKNFWGVRTDKPPKRESVVAAWFRAYKQKHCPLVELVD